jgi:hypothetical protein
MSQASGQFRPAISGALSTIRRIRGDSMRSSVTVVRN